MLLTQPWCAHILSGGLTPASSVPPISAPLPEWNTVRKSIFWSLSESKSARFMDGSLSICVRAKGMASSLSLGAPLSAEFPPA